MSCVAPGPLGFGGLPGMLLFANIGDPGVGPDSPSGDLRAAPLGCLFVSRINGGLWVKTGPSDPNALLGSWTAK